MRREINSCIHLLAPRLRAIVVRSASDALRNYSENDHDLLVHSVPSPPCPVKLVYILLLLGPLCCSKRPPFSSAFGLILIFRMLITHRRNERPISALDRPPQKPENNNNHHQHQHHHHCSSSSASERAQSRRQSRPSQTDTKLR